MPVTISKLVNILILDTVLVKNWLRFYYTLNAPTAEVIQWEMGFLMSIIQPDQLFTKILENWKSQRGNKATISLLSKSLLQIGCKNALDSLLKYKRKKSGDDVISTLQVDYQRSNPKMYSWSPLNPFLFGVTDPIYNFCGRKKETQRLQKLFNGKGKKLVLLSGLGGIGKTELVRHFIKRHLGKDETTTCTSWFNGDSIESLRTSITLFATLLGIRLAEIETPKEILKKCLQVIHEKCEHRRWLVILDNVDGRAEDVLNAVQLLLTSEKAFVIATSRVRDLFADEAELIDIEELSIEDAQKLVRNSVNVDDSENVILLCQKLQNYPLALQQAIAFINIQQRNSIEGNGYGISNYLERFKKEAKTLLGFPSKLISDKYEKSTLITWNVTKDIILNQYQEVGRKALGLLNIVAFLNPDGILLRLLRHLFCIYESSNRFEINFEKSILLLKNYSMVSVDNCVLRVHRLVQKVTQIQLKDSTSLLTKLLTIINMENLDEVDICHVIRLWYHASQSDELIQQFSNFPNKLCYKLRDFSLYCDLYDFSITNCSRLKIALGDECLETLLMERHQAVAFALKGNYEEALHLHLSLYNKAKRVFGQRHEITLVTVQNLGVVLLELQRYEKALECWRMVLNLLQETSGAEIKSIVRTKLNIGTVLGRLGKYSEAMKKYEEVLKWECQELEENHPQILITRHNIAGCLFGQNKFEKAKVELEKVLKLRTEILGEKHSSTLDTKQMYAFTHYQLGEREKAIEMLQQVILLQEKVLGVDHPHTISSRNAIIEFEYALHNWPATNVRSHKYLKDYQRRSRGRWPGPHIRHPLFMSRSS